MAEKCALLDCYATCSSRISKELPLRAALWRRRVQFSEFFFFFLSSTPLIDVVGVLDRISGFGNIEEMSFPGVLMNGTVSIFSQ